MSGEKNLQLFACLLIHSFNHSFTHSSDRGLKSILLTLWVWGVSPYRPPALSSAFYKVLRIVFASIDNGSQLLRTTLEGYDDKFSNYMAGSGGAVSPTTGISMCGQMPGWKDRIYPRAMMVGRSWILHHRKSAKVSLYGLQEEQGTEAMSGLLFWLVCTGSSWCLPSHWAQPCEEGTRDSEHRCWWEVQLTFSKALKLYLFIYWLVCIHMGHGVEVEVRGQPVRVRPLLSHGYQWVN